MRRYQAADGQWAELAVIAGHRKRSIHTPAVCMVGGGWDTLTQQTATLPLSGRPIPAMRLLMSKEGKQLLVTYFFTDGDACLNNLVQFQGFQALKRLRGQAPLGALARIIVPVCGDAEQAARETDAFAQATLPGTLAALRQTHLGLR
jgi:EpsI family protein